MEYFTEENHFILLNKWIFRMYYLPKQMSFKHKIIKNSHIESFFFECWNSWGHIRKKYYICCWSTLEWSLILNYMFRDTAYHPLRRTGRKPVWDKNPPKRRHLENPGNLAGRGFCPLPHSELWASTVRRVLSGISSTYTNRYHFIFQRTNLLKIFCYSLIGNQYLFVSSWTIV